MHNRISPDILISRLDAEYYSQEQVLNITTLEKFGAFPLKDVCSDINVGYTGELTSQYVLSGVPLYRVSDINGVFLEEDDVKFVSKALADDNPQIWVNSGDIVLAAVGNTIGKVAIKSSSLSEGVCSRALMIVRPNQGIIDSHFLVAYLGCKYAQKSLIRGISGSAQPVLNTPLITNLPIVKVHHDVQAYVGDKIRLAEQYRERAKELHSNVQLKLKSVIGKYDTNRRLHGRVSSALLSERLDQNYYQSHLIDSLKCLLKGEYCTLSSREYFSELRDGDHGNPIYGEDGPIYIRANEIGNGMVDREGVVRLDSNYAKEVSKSCWANDGDVVFSIVGTLGQTAVIDDETSGVMSRGIAKVKSKVLPNYYVKAFFKSDYFENQLTQNSVGTIQRGVYLESLKKLVIPIIPVKMMEDIDDCERLADHACMLSDKLVRFSKLLIESIVSGRISEREVISAQQSLSAGDDSKDKVILSQITECGYAVNDCSPLFQDVNALFEIKAKLDIKQVDKGDSWN